jgi:hypothetical protein
MAKMSKWDKGNGNITHGLGFFLRTGRISPTVYGHRRLQEYLRDMERALVEEQGGAKQLSIKEELLIKSSMEAYGIILLAAMYCKKHGVLEPKKLKDGIIDLQPILSRSMIAYQNTLRQNLLALSGMKRIVLAKLMRSEKDFVKSIEWFKDKGSEEIQGNGKTDEGA